MNLKKFNLKAVIGIVIIALVGFGLLDEKTGNTIKNNVPDTEIDLGNILGGDEPANPTTSGPAETSAPVPGTTPFNYSTKGGLTDVSNGTAFGVAKAGFVYGQYRMEAIMENLPDPEGDFFYEGWIVKRGVNQSVISSGIAVKEAEGTYSNTFESNKDLTANNFYVLTLEPNDGDPAPAEHVLEGTMN